MSSERKIEANRRNALKSCGPRTTEGKRIASQNARKYGFFSTHILLSDEDQNQYFRLARGVVEHHMPVGAFEAEFVVSIIQTLWQLRRANLIDTELFAMYRFYENEERGVGTAFANDASQANSFSKLIRYQAHLQRKLFVGCEAIASGATTEWIFPAPLGDTRHRIRARSGAA
jgi:hypothetical protein